MDHAFHRSLLSVLAARIQPSCFLELGVHQDPALLQVARHCEHVVGVDRSLYLIRWPSNSAFYQMTTDEFFAGPAKEITPPELVFVDACHRKEQVLRDLDGIESICAENCVVVLHDTFPPSAEFTSDNDCSDSYLVPGLARWPSVTLPVPPGITMLRMRPTSLV